MCAFERVRCHPCGRLLTEPGALQADQGCVTSLKELEGLEIGRGGEVSPQGTLIQYLTIHSIQWQPTLTVKPDWRRAQGDCQSELQRGLELVFAKRYGEAITARRAPFFRAISLASDPAE